MIQRIQSLYLLLATAAYVCLFFFPFASYHAGETQYHLTVLGVMEGNFVTKPAVFLLAGTIVLAVLTFSIIFFFKKRMLQSKLTAISLLLNVGLIAGMFFYSDSVVKDYNTKAVFETGAYIVLVPLVFLVLANRAIRRDEMKVRAADRLR